MRNIEAIRYKNRLDALFKKVEIISDIELKAHWARYLCVLVSGFLEVSISSIFSEYSRNKSAPIVANYVTKRLSSLQNPNMARILELTNSFSPSWGECLEKTTNGELKEAIDSIYANRNKIAHGVDTGISFHRISKYYQDSLKVVEFIENQCKNG